MTTHTVQTAKGMRYTYVAEDPKSAIQMATREIRASGQKDHVVNITTKK